ncbi:ABC transporter permease [Acaryochloris sp. 'Moss Beach']|uniref:ABC transporter permease n=1 Tax=Acaryochloris TaxID=155977 RepID=UPI001BAF3A2C|nr:MULTISPECIES: ABC transporter permease [Acaryochloris]QUY41835.1 ABC transporter permease [Acaryochloris marina S15]UJB70991.1 ABC transporter permease [Acaryochloris sp. 'Moss Beach']
MPRFNNLYWDAAQKLSRQKLVVICLGIIAVYIFVALLGILNLLPDYQTRVATGYEAPSLGLAKLLGTDIFGRSVLYKILAGTKTAMLIGILVTSISVPLGVTLGAVAGYYGGLVDVGIVWLYTVISSVPYILMVIAISYVIGKGLVAICLAMGLLGWVGLCRLIRSEVLKNRNLEYVAAARVIGANDLQIIFRHILPNVVHLAIISASLQILGAIKSEVILTFLGVGIQDGASWGSMISDATGELVQGIWWPLAGVVFTMFLIIYALNVVSDALRDALDPKLRGSTEVVEEDSQLGAKEAAVQKA